VEDRFIRNVGNHIQGYTASLPRRPESTVSPPWKPQISYKRWITLNNAHFWTACARPELAYLYPAAELRALFIDCSASNQPGNQPGYRQYQSHKQAASFAVCQSSCIYSISTCPMRKLLKSFVLQTLLTNQLHGSHNFMRSLQWRHVRTKFHPNLSTGLELNHAKRRTDGQRGRQTDRQTWPARYSII
jgi:hypothetical protein